MKLDLGLLLDLHVGSIFPLISPQTPHSYYYMLSQQFDNCKMKLNWRSSSKKKSRSVV